MRVIAGEARGRKLRSVPGGATRPITDRAKEALFSILMPHLPGSRFLDLYAGTGGVGIEAISRGSSFCAFVERDDRAVRTIHENLEHTGLADRAQVLRRDVFAYLRSSPATAFDVVYIAPPQYVGLWRKTLEALDAADGWLAEDGVAVAQIHPREHEDLGLVTLEESDRRTYGSVMLLFFEQARLLR